MNTSSTRGGLRRPGGALTMTRLLECISRVPRAEGRSGAAALGVGGQQAPRRGAL